MIRNLMVCAIAVALPLSPIQADDSAERSTASLGVIKEFAKTLKGHREGATKKGGPGHAVEVCRDKAPEVARELGEREGWAIKRTSLKLRNPKNAPDPWETKVMKSFESRKAAGESIYTMDHAEFTEVDGQPVFRYMKAIPMGGFCTNCHASKVARGVEPKLKELYPDDKARGFMVGDIRGAFSIIQPK